MMPNSPGAIGRLSSCWRAGCARGRRRGSCVPLGTQQPDTVLRWHRELFRRIWQRKSNPKQKQGRPPLKGDLVALIKCIAKENLTWRAERIRGERAPNGCRAPKGCLSRSTSTKSVNLAPRSRPGPPSYATTPARYGRVISCRHVISSFARCSCPS